MNQGQHESLPGRALRKQWPGEGPKQHAVTAANGRTDPVLHDRRPRRSDYTGAAKQSPSADWLLASLHGLQQTIAAKRDRGYDATGSETR
jgi:hypothetical protein